MPAVSNCVVAVPLEYSAQCYANGSSLGLIIAAIDAATRPALPDVTRRPLTQKDDQLGIRR